LFQAFQFSFDADVLIFFGHFFVDVLRFFGHFFADVLIFLGHFSPKIGRNFNQFSGHTVSAFNLQKIDPNTFFLIFSLLVPVAGFKPLILGL
jgi:hypothetical protein